MSLEFVRIGDKVISKSKIQKEIDKILALRAKGCSQQETAELRGIDRSFISRVESIGELLKGRNIGVIGFPIKNKEQILSVLHERGISNCLIMSEAERLHFVGDKTGAELVNEIMTLLGEFRNYDTVIVMASDRRGRLIQALLDQQVVLLDIGNSPLTEDVHLDIERLEEVLDAVLDD
jgi:hypothetical protein